ncbi:MAG: recombinase family protein [Methylobacter sp.]
MATKETSSDRKTVAYLRVSRLDQDLEKNKTDILHFANHHDLCKVNFVEEVASGRKPWRERQIAQVLEELQSGDAIARYPQEYPSLFSEGKLATGRQYPKQNHCAGVFDDGRNRTRSDFATNKGSATLQKKNKASRWVGPKDLA